MERTFFCVCVCAYVVYLNYSRLLSLRTSTCVMINVVFLCFNSYDQKHVLFGTSQFSGALSGPRWGARRDVRRQC